MKLAIVLLSIFAVGCASSGKFTEQGTYKSNYEVTEFKKIRTQECPATKKIINIKDLDNMMEAANACVKTNAWTRVDLLGTRMLEKHSAAPWGAYYKALHATHAKNFQRALWMIDLGLKKSPNLSLLVYEKGRIEWLMGSHEQAVTDVKRAIDLDDQLLEAHVFLGQIYLRDGNMKRSKLHFTRANSLDRGNLQAIKGLGETMMALKNYAEAEKYFEQVIDDESTNLVAYLKLASLKEKYMQKQASALSLYKKIKKKFASYEIKKVAGFDINTKLNTLKQLIAQQEAQKRKISSVNKKQGVK